MGTIIAAQSSFENNGDNVYGMHRTEFLACGRLEPQTQLCSFPMAQRSPVEEMNGMNRADIHLLHLFLAKFLFAGKGQSEGWVLLFWTKVLGWNVVALWVSCLYYHPVRTHTLHFQVVFGNFEVSLSST